MNRRKHANIVPVAALVRWGAAFAFILTSGLGYVYFKNQLQTRGNEMRNLEAQLNTLTTEDDTERAQIDRLSSHSYLQRRLAEGFIHLTPIRDDRIVRVHLAGSHSSTAAVDRADEVQPVSNRISPQ